MVSVEKRIRNKTIFDRVLKGERFKEIAKDMNMSLAQARNIFWDEWRYATAKSENPEEAKFSLKEIRRMFSGEPQLPLPEKKKRGPYRNEARLARNYSIMEKVLTGTTLDAVAKEHGMTRERIRQITNVEFHKKFPNAYALTENRHMTMRDRRRIFHNDFDLMEKPVAAEEPILPEGQETGTKSKESIDVS